MSTKAEKPKFRYLPEDLESRDPVADEAAVDAWVKRNKGALNESIRQADEEFARGEYYTLDEVMAELKARRAARQIKS
jgi:antitoxin ParD1/3/4